MESIEVEIVSSDTRIELKAIASEANIYVIYLLCWLLRRALLLVTAARRPASQYNNNNKKDAVAGNAGDTGYPAEFFLRL